MEPIVIALSTQVSLTNRGVQWPRGSLGTFSNFTFRGFIRDALIDCTEVWLYGRGTSGGWVKIDQQELFQASIGIGLIPGQASSSFFTQFAMIPLLRDQPSRRIEVQQINF